MKMVVWIRLQEHIDVLRNQITQIEGKIETARGVLRDLDIAHPDYRLGWIDNYNVERRKAGIPDYTPTNREEERYAATVAAPDSASL